jgi:hypothetical protein
VRDGVVGFHESRGRKYATVLAEEA